jgi:nucleoid DNA-binding protein
MAARSISMTEISKRIEGKIGVKPNLAKNVIHALQEVIEDEIAAGSPISIPGLVKFSHGYRPMLPKGREIRNPQTNEMTKATESRPASITVRATALKKVKQAAPSPTSKAGKPIADLGKERAKAAAARKKEREAEATA